MPRSAKPAPAASPAGTRARLLEAAGEIFAEQGFRAATVRDICERAGANVAAVHYHFHDKARLYAAVLQHAHGCALERFPAQVPGGQDAPAGERLLGFVRAFLQRIFDGGQPAWFGQLIAREMIEPTPALDALVESNIRPQCEALMGIVRELLGPGAAEERVRWCTGSIVGQCVFYHHSRPVIARLFPQQRYAPADIERLAEHIASFSAHGLAALRDQPGAALRDKPGAALRDKPGAALRDKPGAALSGRRGAVPRDQPRGRRDAARRGPARKGRGR